MTNNYARSSSLTESLHVIGRTTAVFAEDWTQYAATVQDAVRGQRILVIGGAGSIGGKVSERLYHMSPSALHVVDVNENGLADLVRQIRSSTPDLGSDFRTFCFDPLHRDAELFVRANGPYSVILNFAAVKHVRSEKDPFTLDRMIAVNLHLMALLCKWAETCNSEVLFSVSTDKAANPANIMGASKRLMEMLGFQRGRGRFSTARFANVAFSAGSLLKAFLDRIDFRQPIAAPSDIRRFFITHDEAAYLCLLKAFAAPTSTIAIPRAPGEIELTSFVDVARRILESRGYEPLLCDSEEEARRTNVSNGKWPCYFFESDTSGEKPFEEFIAEDECLVDSPFSEISLIGQFLVPTFESLDSALAIDPLRMNKEEIVRNMSNVVPGFSHRETGKSLDERM